MLSFHRWTVNGQMNVIRRLNYRLIPVLVSFFFIHVYGYKRNFLPKMACHVMALMLGFFFGTERFKFLNKGHLKLRLFTYFQGHGTSKRINEEERFTYQLVLLQDKPSKIGSWSKVFDVIINFHVVVRVVDS